VVDAERFIFTVATGRCGQSSLTELVEHHVPDCCAAFEAPDIKPLLPPPLDAYERWFRRKFIETHELLGRGKVLTAFEQGDDGFIETVAAKRLRMIRKDLKLRGVSIYFDISKFFARGLHRGFAKAIGRFAVVNLVRDPIRNMRSFLNRDKSFRLDNNLPDARSNILRLPSSELSPGEHYLWAWCELYLRFEEMRQLDQVTHAVEIRTEDLVKPQKMNAAFDALELAHSPVVARPPSNTNTQRGLPETRISVDDIRLFERFADRIPALLYDRIVYLRDYDPWAHHSPKPVEAHASLRA
jgi:hypothetical protein